VPLLGAALHDQHGQPAATRTDSDHHLLPQREAGELGSDVVEDQVSLPARYASGKPTFS